MKSACLTLRHHLSISSTHHLLEDKRASSSPNSSLKLTEVEMNFERMIGG